MSGAREITAQHRSACELSELALAVAQADSGQFAGYLDWLFVHQTELTLAAARQEAVYRVGKERLDAILKAGDVSRWLQADVTLAQQYGVKSVPQIFVRKGRVSGIVERSALQKMLDEQFPLNR